MKFSPHSKNYSAHTITIFVIVVATTLSKCTQFVYFLRKPCFSRVKSTFLFGSLNLGFGSRVKRHFFINKKKKVRVLHLVPYSLFCSLQKHRYGNRYRHRTHRKLYSFAVFTENLKKCSNIGQKKNYFHYIPCSSSYRHASMPIYTCTLSK